MHNPYPGTIVFEQLSSPHVYDFHLAAQATTQGTATLTSYQIAYDASQIPEEAIAQFTMEQCYNYPNWQGGIKVPNCLQSADRLSRLVGEHIHQDIVDKQFDGQKIWHLRNTPFYLWLRSAYTYYKLNIFNYHGDRKGRFVFACLLLLRHSRRDFKRVYCSSNCWSTILPVFSIFF